MKDAHPFLKELASLPGFESSFVDDIISLTRLDIQLLPRQEAAVKKAISEANRKYSVGSTLIEQAMRIADYLNGLAGQVVSFE